MIPPPPNTPLETPLLLCRTPATAFTVNPSTLLYRTVATVIVHPLDVLKNRMQMAGRDLTATEAQKSMGGIVRSMVKDKGVAAFYPGLTAGMLRQATYSTTRLGMYNSLIAFMTG